MSKLMKFFAAVALIGGLFAFAPNAALAQHHGGWHGGGYHGGWHGGGWRGRGWGWGPAVGLGIGAGWGWGWGYPYGYYAPGPSYYYAPQPERCGYVRVRVWRQGHWAFRRAWRCW